MDEKLKIIKLKICCYFFTKSVVIFYQMNVQLSLEILCGTKLKFNPAILWTLRFILIYLRQADYATPTALCVYLDATRMWANAQPDGRPAEHWLRPLFNAAKFSWRPLLDAVQ